MTMHPVVSTNVAAVGYDPLTHTLRVQFLSGGTYAYYDVHSSLFEHMLLPYPWRRVGQRVKTHAYVKVA